MNYAKRIVLSGFFLVLGILLPFLTAQNQDTGSVLLPMHIPVLLCGFVCGGGAGLVVGAICPLLRALLLGMPPLFPVALCMAFELAAYGFFAGLFYALAAKHLNRKKVFPCFFALVFAMIFGRLVWGAAASVFYPMSGEAMDIMLFFYAAFIRGAVGMFIQIAFIPPLVCAIKNYEREK